VPNQAPLGFWSRYSLSFWEKFVDRYHGTGIVKKYLSAFNWNIKTIWFDYTLI